MQFIEILKEPFSFYLDFHTTCSVSLSESPQQQRIHAPSYIFTPILTQTSNSKGKNRTRDIISYKPPFSKKVAKNVGCAFLEPLDVESPEEHVLHKIFNRNTVKISCSCMPNLKQNIDRHSKSILHNQGPDALGKFLCILRKNLSSFPWYKCAR